MKVFMVQAYITSVNFNKLLEGMLFKPLPDMPISGSSNSAANKDMMSKI